MDAVSGKVWVISYFGHPVGSLDLPDGRAYLRLRVAYRSVYVLYIDNGGKSAIAVYSRL